MGTLKCRAKQVDRVDVPMELAAAVQPTRRVESGERVDMRGSLEPDLVALLPGIRTLRLSFQSAPTELTS